MTVSEPRRRRRHAVTRLLRVGLLCGLIAGAPPALADEELLVVIERPEAGVPVFGDVEVEVDLPGIDAARIERLELFVDDAFVDALRAPPWRFVVDVGEDNAEHRLEVVAQARDGGRASALLVTPAIRVDLELDASLRQLYVTVTRGARRVLYLDRDDFTVVDDGVEQALVTFERGDVPLTALLLVDASESMRGDRLRSAVAGAAAFVRGMASLDQARLVLFSDRLLHRTPFTNVPEVLEAGLLGIEPNGGTALLDPLWIALEALETVQGRRVVVLLSDGVDIASVTPIDEIEQAIDRSRAIVYWVRLGRFDREARLYSAWHDADEHRDQIDRLVTAVERSGGRVVPIRSTDEASDAFSTILAELRDQYVLGYYPSPADDGPARWRRVEVEVEESGNAVRHRKGYSTGGMR
ncbi:MAG: VWA domain-containing protein [Acidobacteriota bacterium]